jgi:ubiquinol-cytochrome c reductase iron-sulfur subunit
MVGARSSLADGRHPNIKDGPAMSSKKDNQNPALAIDPNVERRDFINIAAVSFAGVGALATLVPLISQMAPSADVLAESSTDVDLSQIVPGQGIKAIFHSQPLFVRQLTAKEIAEAVAVPLSLLRDPQTLEARTKPGKSNWLITMGVCTHLGCVPLGINSNENRGEFGGYFCPCHGSQYDTAARIRKGPAPSNLVVPPYIFTSNTTIRVG